MDDHHGTLWHWKSLILASTWWWLKGKSAVLVEPQTGCAKRNSSGNSCYQMLIIRATARQALEKHAWASSSLQEGRHTGIGPWCQPCAGTSRSTVSASIRRQLMGEFL